MVHGTTGRPADQSRPLSDREGRIRFVRVAVVPGAGREGLLCPLDQDGRPAGAPVAVEDLAAAIAAREADVNAAHEADAVRWVWYSTATVYPALARSDVFVNRCHDVSLTQALLTTRDGAIGGSAGGTGGSDADAEPDDSTAVRYEAALRQLLNAQPLPATTAGSGAAQEPLFDLQPGRHGEPTASSITADHARTTLDALIEVYAGQVRRITADDRPARFTMLAAAESAGAMAAVEMSLTGLPWRADIHDTLLTEMLGPRPVATLAGTHTGSGSFAARPPRLAELAARISASFDPRKPVNPDSPGQVIRALGRAGITVPSARMAALKKVDHPAIPALLEYKELSRLHSAFGWHWLDTWVKDGRFRPEYVVGGVVSGRWASRGGGALQIPRLLRRAVVADPGWVLVVADAAQLEPRVLAALAGDRAFAAAAADGDLYAALAALFGGDRAKAKVAMLSAMYGGAGGEAGQLLAVLRRRFPAAAAYAEDAARAGREGRTVRSALGRTCPAPSARWRAMTTEAAEPDGDRAPGAELALRARGRFTRNFVVQSSAADWALVLLARLRARIARMPGDDDSADLVRRARQPAAVRPRQRRPGHPELVFFQHDEVIVHCPGHLADQVASAATESAAEATALVFGPTPVLFPLNIAVVECYADAK